MNPEMEICRGCIAKKKQFHNNKGKKQWFKNFAKNWKRGHHYCPASSYHMKIHGVKESCPYYLEHFVSEGNSHAQ